MFAAIALSLQLAGSPIEADPVEAFYAARGGELAWTGPGREHAYDALVEALGSASAHGLDPALYDYPHLRAADPSQTDPELDRRATSQWMALAEDLATGRIDPFMAGADLDPPLPPGDLPERLNAAIAADNLSESLDALAPQRIEYRALQAALRDYRALAKEGGWPLIEAGETLHPGDVDPRVVQLRRRIEAEGRLAPLIPPGEAADEDILSAFALAEASYDDSLAAAVTEVQRGAHLEADGVAGADTIAWLNIPIEQRIAQIEANLERWRWMPRTAETLRVEVNIPDYRLSVFGAEGLVRTHDVIVGRRSRPSPRFSAEMRYMILNPWWETPHRLAVYDELPLFRRDPAAVERLGFVILDRSTGEAVDASTIDWSAVSARDFPYRLRQRPGPLNALGRVKFIFPNPHSTFLHDTSARELFERPARAFSSGCVRVRDAEALADWVARTATETDLETLHAALASGAETRIDLVRPIAVHFLYFTALADREGGVRFVPDLYGLDARLIAALGDAPMDGDPPDETVAYEPSLSDGSECGVGI